MKVELSHAEIGLIYSLALENFQKDQHGMDYEVVPTGEKASVQGLLTKFGHLVTGVPDRG